MTLKRNCERLLQLLGLQLKMLVFCSLSFYEKLQICIGRAVFSQKNAKV